MTTQIQYQAPSLEQMAAALGQLIQRPEFVMSALGVLGAGLGAATAKNKQDRLRRALLGGLIGADIGAYAGVLAPWLKNVPGEATPGQ